MSRSQRSRRTGSLFEDASVAIQTLIKQPVKDAVREALAEERASTQERAATERGPSTGQGDESSRGGGKSGVIWRFGLLAVLAGIAYYAKQRRGIEVGEELTQKVGTGGREEETGPSMEDPLSPEREESGEEMSEESTDEGPTTSS